MTVDVLCLFLAVPWVGLRCVAVAFSVHINRLFAYCKGGNFNSGLTISSHKEGKSGFIYNLVKK